MKRQEMEQTRETFESFRREITEEKRKEIFENLVKLSVLSENRYTNFFDLALVDSKLKGLIRSLENQIEVNQREEQAEELSNRVTHVGADYEPDYDEVSNYGKW